MSKQFSPKPVISADTLQRILDFRDERNWKQFHNPKDLAISLSLEAAELLECFQWSGEDTEVAGKTAAMKEELSDVVIYALLLADRLGLDLDAAVREKNSNQRRKIPGQRKLRKFRQIRQTQANRPLVMTIIYRNSLDHFYQNSPAIPDLLMGRESSDAPRNSAQYRAWSTPYSSCKPC